MLLRRIKHHVVNENRFAVFVDFVIVGVYVGRTVLACFQGSKVDPCAAASTNYDELKAAGGFHE